MRDPDLTQLEQLVLNPDGPGWQFTEAGIDYYFDGGDKHHMVVLGDPELGYYLQFLGARGSFDPDDVWLSLGDRSRLTEVVCPDDCEASAGLFIPSTNAWEAIKDFCVEGRRSSAIEWISHREVPAAGAW